MERKNGRMVLVPYPAQGHVSPMQKLGWELVREGYEVVIVVPEFIKRQIVIDEKDEIKWVGVVDGLEIEEKEIDFFGIERVMENMMPIELEMLIRNMGGSDEVKCLIVDLLASWAIKVAHNSSIPCAAFWPAMFATYLFISSIPHLLQTRLISNTGLPEHHGKFWLEPQLPVISTEELPWLVGTEVARIARFKFWKRALERSSGLKWLLVNSFPQESKVELQSELMEVTNKYNNNCTRVFPIGPIFNCKKELKSVSFWEEDFRCLKWLENKKPKSVVYISFGSWVSPIEEEKLKNMAVAIEASGRPFIWVLRSTWLHALPLGFLERVINKNQGMVVSWAPQYQILQHNSVACYITHCGWNSILEALQFKMKLLCYPVAGDQFVNCAYVVDVWRIGLKLNAIEPNYVEQGILRVLNDKEMDNRLRKLNRRIMPCNYNNTVSLILNTFLQDLN